MNCAEFEIVLADYLDGTLSTNERAAVEEHAAVCTACAEFMQDVSGAVNFLNRAPKPAPPT